MAFDYLKDPGMPSKFFSLRKGISFVRVVLGWMFEFCGMSGKYIRGTSFDQLVELARLDLFLRRILLTIAIDIEFSGKLEINLDCSQNPADDGYLIVSSFPNQNPKLFIEYQNRASKGDSEYGSAVLTKHFPNLAAWHLLEIISFGGFISFWRYYYVVFPKPGLNVGLRNNQLFATKKLRNACAHNDFVLASLRKRPRQQNKQLNTLLPNILRANGVFLTSPERRLFQSSTLMCDMISMLILFDEVVKNDSLRRGAHDSLFSFFEAKVSSSLKLFFNNPQLIEELEVMKKITYGIICTWKK